MHEKTTPRYILVTGAAKRLGRSLAMQLAQDGWSVILHYRKSLEEVQKTQKECYRIAKKNKREQCFDIVSADFLIDEEVTHFGKYIVSKYETSLYALINNVGEYVWQKPSISSINRTKQLFHTNFFVPIELIQILIPSIQKRQGRIINIGTAGLHKQSADIHAPMYHASKLSLLYLTRSFAKEFAPYKVCVNMVSPGVLNNSIDIDQVQNQLPFGRPGFLHEVAHVVSFLLKEENAYITGQNIEVSGAYCL